jgi:6-phosphogluconolactonase
MPNFQSLLTGLSLALVAVVARAADDAELVYFGTRGSGEGQGIYAARFDPKSGHLSALGRVAEIARPTWLVVHPKLPILYSVSETGNDGHSESAIFSLAVDRSTGALRVLNHMSSGGGGATHLAVDGASRTLFVAHYGTGQVSSLPIQPDGSLGAVVSNQTHSGSGPNPRQTSPHAHAVAVDPSRRFVLSADLGADRIFIYRLDAASHQLSPAEPAFEQVTPGSGPRHLAFHPNGRWVFVLTELSAEVLAYRWDHGHLQLVQTATTLAPDFAGKKSGAEIALSRNGRYLYISNRGENAIVVYAVNARTGALHEEQRIGSQGEVPWSFAFDPSGRWMLVANETSGNVAVFKVDPATGRLAATEESLSVPHADNVTFLPPH